MAIQKIILFFLTIVLIQASCQEVNESKDELSRDLEAADREIINQMTRDIFYQDSVMRVIRAELDNVDALYIRFERNVEMGVNPETRADIIIDRIRHLNNLLENTRADLKRGSIENKGLIELIDRFKKELNVKDKKIRELELKVSDQELQIEEKVEIIERLEGLSKEQKEEIMKMEKEIRNIKIRAYNDLADLLVEIVSDMPEVRGLFTRTTKIELENLQKTLITDAIKYYNESLRFGNDYARGKITELKNKYPEMDLPR